MYKVCVYEKTETTDFIDSLTTYYFNDFKKAQSFYMLKCRIVDHCSSPPDVTIISLLTDGYPEVTLASRTILDSED